MYGVNLAPTGSKEIEIYNTPEKAPRRVWLTHVDGLRGLAILLVVIFHVFVGKVSSGVDVFLFLGGMFLLSSQMKNAFNPAGMSFIQSIIRIIRRLYPALILVVVSTGIMGLIVYPTMYWGSLSSDIAAAVTYYTNIQLWEQGNSYATAGDDPSIYQHLWSMSAQIQIYVVIIALIAGIGMIMKYRHGQKEFYSRVIVGIFSVVTLASFFYAWWMTGNDQTLNYYSPLSRFWEIGAGALFGHLFLHRLVFPQVFRWIASIIGLAAIFFTGLFLDGAQQFPGPLTLIPLIGAALVVAAGQTNDSDRSWISLGPGFLLDTSPARTLGKLSYSLYLWHWPILILALELSSENSVSWWLGIIVIGASLALAYITNRFVEEPLKQKTKPEYVSLKTMLHGRYIEWVIRQTNSMAKPVSAVVIVVGMILSLSAPIAYNTYASIQSNRLEETIKERGGIDVVYTGAQEFLANQPSADDMDPYPDSNANMDPPTQDNGCYVGFEGTDLKLTDDDGENCLYGDAASDQVLYVIGGSHSEHYIPALDIIGQHRGFAVQPILKMGCAPYHTVKYDGSFFEDCIGWSDNLVDYVIDNPPSMGIFMTGSRPAHQSGLGPEIVPEKYVEVVQEFADNHIKSYLIRDNPWMMQEEGSHEQKSARQCVHEGGTIIECGQPWDWTMNDIDPMIEAYQDIPHVRLMDASHAYSRDGFIYPLVGGILVFRDTHHLTSQFVLSMTEYIDSLMFD